MTTAEFQDVINDVRTQRRTTMKEFDDLTAEVANETTVDDSAVLLLNRLASLLSGNPTPAQVTAIAQQLRTNADAMAAAITANTPAAASPPAGGTPPPPATGGALPAA